MKRACDSSSFDGGGVKQSPPRHPKSLVRRLRPHVEGQPAEPDPRGQTVTNSEPIVLQDGRSPSERDGFGQYRKLAATGADNTLPSKDGKTGSEDDLQDPVTIWGSKKPNGKKDRQGGIHKSLFDEAHEKCDGWWPQGQYRSKITQQKARGNLPSSRVAGSTLAQ
jgi:hypothetical protein